jgi:hypothetical protein
MNNNGLYMDSLTQECLVFCRYLSGVSPDNYVLNKYNEANKINSEMYRNQKTYFEEILILMPFFFAKILFLEKNLCYYWLFWRVVLRKIINWTILVSIQDLFYPL